VSVGAGSTKLTCGCFDKFVLGKACGDRVFTSRIRHPPEAPVEGSTEF